jgi:glutamate formiminotransferase
VKLPKETLTEVENVIIKNKHLGYTTKEEFIRQAIRFYLKLESEKYEHIEIPKQKHNKLSKALKEMNMPYYNATEFIERPNRQNHPTIRKMARKD